LHVVAGEVPFEVAVGGEPLVHLVVAEALRREPREAQAEGHRDRQREEAELGAAPRLGAPREGGVLAHGAVRRHRQSGLGGGALGAAEAEADAEADADGAGPTRLWWGMSFVLSKWRVMSSTLSPSLIS